MTNATISDSQRNLTTPLELLAVLARFHDEEARAVSFYFSRSSFADKAHREERVSVEHLVDEARSRNHSEVIDPGLSKDLEQILSMESGIRESPAVFRAIFACSNRQIWHEVNLPIRADIGHLDCTKHFLLVPLLRAMEACTPYCAVMIERGKARIFSIRGNEVVEMKDLLESEDLSLDADDSRVGWSHHIDADVEERTKAYMKDLTHQLQQLIQSSQFQYLVVGCRKDVWSEIEPHLAKAGLSSMVAGHFTLSNFEMSPNDVVQAATPVFEKKRRQRYTELWEGINETVEQSAIGVDQVLRNLEIGRVQTLLLGDLAGTHVTECSHCNSWSLNLLNDICASCGTTGPTVMPAEELLLRKALLTRATIVAPDKASLSSFGEVGAMLRY